MRALPERKAPGAGEQTGRILSAILVYLALAFPANIFRAAGRFFGWRHGELMHRHEWSRK